MKVAVLEHSLWTRQEVCDALHDALEFVTGDFWEITFERDLQKYKWPTRFLPFSKIEGSPLICLYSGGLDSAAGLVTRINENPGRLVIPVTVWHQPGQCQLVQRQYDFLRRHFRTQRFRVQIEPLIVKFAMMCTTTANQKTYEPSQRSRSLLFTALAAIAAVMHGQPLVEIFESGIGAINLPLMAGMVGWKVTRSSHPEFLRRMSKLVSLVADTELTFTLPFKNRTKAEVVSALAEAELLPLAAMCPSCVHYPLRHKDYKQCGLCAGCVLRRAALASAGIDEPDDMYRHDFLGPPDRINALPRTAMLNLYAILLQVARLRDIEKTDRLPLPFERHVLGTGIIQSGESQKSLVDLLARYRDEWLPIASAACDRGHAWARLLVPERPAIHGVTRASA